MSEVCCAAPSPPPRRNGLRTACSSALAIDRLLTRYAPHSALIRSQGVPQTFSVYSLKNCR